MGQGDTIKQVVGIRTVVRTGQEREVPVIVQQRIGSSEKWWVWIISGGVTGYESFCSENIKDLLDGWCACAGTKDRWDMLFIPSDQMKRIQEWLEIENS